MTQPVSASVAERLSSMVELLRTRRDNLDVILDHARSELEQIMEPVQLALDLYNSAVEDVNDMIKGAALDIEEEMDDLALKREDGASDPDVEAIEKVFDAWDGLYDSVCEETLDSDPEIELFGKLPDDATLDALLQLPTGSEPAPSVGALGFAERTRVRAAGEVL